MYSPFANGESHVNFKNPNTETPAHMQEACSTLGVGLKGGTGNAEMGNEEMWK